MRERFRREARLSASLRHEHVVSIFDVFEGDDGSYGIVMELLNCKQLRTLIGTDAFTVQRAVDVAYQLLDALQYLERRGIVRIDLKPENVMIRDDGRAVLIDFGIAKPVTELHDRHFLTQTGTTIGTPAYMSREQAMGEAIDIRSDIYNLGLVLIEMISGEVPVANNATSPLAVLMARVNEDIDVSGLQVSDGLRSVAGRAVARDREQRFQTPLEMRDALSRTPEGARREPEPVLPPAITQTEPAITPIQPAITETFSAPDERRSTG
jgi:serine/threonine-protein kinase